MKLIKIKEDHYVVVDETIQPVNGYYYDDFIKAIRNTNGAEYGEASHCWQITHSTQPLESIVTENSFKSYDFIPLQEVKELIGEVDVEKLYHKLQDDFIDEYDDIFHYYSFVKGYNQAIEDNKEKKYTEEDMRMAYFEGKSYVADTPPYFDNFEQFIQSLQSKTEREVKIVDGKLKLK